MGKLRTWLAEHPWVFTGFLTGIGVGILIALPLLPYKLPDSSAQLIGAFLGAGIAVTGAMWISNHKERRFRSELRLATRSIYEVFKVNLLENIKKLQDMEGQTQPLDQTDILILEDAKRTSEVTKESIEDLRPAFQNTPMDFIVYRHLVGMMNRFVEYFDDEFSRQKSRVTRNTQEQQAPFNRPDMPKMTPQPFCLQGLRDAIKNADSVIRTVGK